MLDEFRKGLLEAFKHRHVEDAWCIACGRANVPMALHVIEFYHADSMKTPSGLVPMSQSGGTTRGGVPLCNVCLPSCSECSLPIATPWAKKLRGALAEKHPGVTFVVGNGICKHIHVLLDVKSLFRSVILGWKPRPFHKNESKEDVADWFAHVDAWSRVDPRLIQILIDRLHGNPMFEVFVHASQDCEVIPEYVALRGLFDKGVGDVAACPQVARILVTAGARHGATFAGLLRSAKTGERDLERHYGNALNACEAAIHVEPGCLLAYLQIAHLRQLLGKTEDAIKFCNQGLEQVEKIKKYPLPRRPEMNLMGAVEDAEKELKSFLRDLKT